MTRKTVVSSQRLNRPVGYFSQAMRVPAGGDLLFISGLTARDQAGRVVAPDDAGRQTRRILENMAALLAEAGATLDDLVKLTVFVRDVKDAMAINEVRRELLGADPPASSLVQVAALADESFRVEIEGVALLPESPEGSRNTEI
jgi:2-iminobutanoate/2-iminopropanoate deaminase